MSMQDVTIVVEVDNTSIKNMQKTIQGIQWNLPVKQINSLLQGVQKLDQVLKAHSKTMGQLLTQVKQVNQKMGKTGSGATIAQLNLQSQQQKTQQKLIQQQTVRDNNVAKQDLLKKSTDAKDALEKLKANNKINQAAKDYQDKMDLLVKKQEMDQKKIDARNKQTDTQKETAEKRFEALREAMETKLQAAEITRIRTAENRQGRMQEREHNLTLQMKKKEFSVFTNTFQDLLKVVPGGGFIAPMAARGFMGKMQQAKDVYAYQQHAQEINKPMSGAMPDYKQREKIARGYGITNIGKTAKEAGGVKGKVLGLAGKFLANPMAAIAAGGVIGMMGKGIMMGLEMSPAFQQVKKLLNFGIMLVLKPIGDFFAMLFRPVLILLLRKFIIPNYQKWMPLMMKWGTDIGNGIVSLLDGTWVTKIPWGDIANTALKIIFPTYGIATLLHDYFTENPIDWNTIIPKFDYENSKLKEGIDGVVAWFTQGLKIEENATNAFNSTIQWFKDLKIDSTVTTAFNNVVAWFKGLKIDSTVTTAFNNVVNWFKGLKIDATVTTAFNGVVDWFKGLSIPTTVTTAWTNLTSWFTNLKMPTIPDSVLTFGDTLKALFDSIINIILTIPTKIWTSISDLGKTISNTFADFLNGFITWYNKANDVFFMPDIPLIKKLANGGIINEPVIGQGQRSGKGYLIGEAGPEAVVPLGKSGAGGTVVNINISNMSGDKRDISELRRVILEVMQSVNTNRGR